MADTAGKTLHDILEAGDALSTEEAIPLVLELASVLEARHKQEKILGGIYPDQVFFEKDGLVQLYELTAPRLPEDLTLLYLGFVPPEVLQNGPVTKQTDIYSLGVILYTMLTGRLPFAAKERDQLTEGILQSRLDEFPAFRIQQLDWIIKKCLILVPARRFASVSEFAQELRKAFRPMRGTQATAAMAGGSLAVKKMQRQSRQYLHLLLEHWKIAAGIAGGLLLVLLIWWMLPETQKVDHTSRTWRITRLTSTPDSEKDPAPSPDGNTIAYVSNATGNFEIYVRGMKSGTPVQVTQSPGDESNPRWSPDGTLILFTYQGPGVQPSIFSVAPTGGIPQQIAGNAVDGQWSPDGKSVCFVTPAAPGVRDLGITVIEALEAHKVVTGIQGLAHPSFSFNGKDIVCEADSDRGHRLFLVKTESGKIQPIGDLEGWSPTWDWKSGWIYFAAPKDGKMQILRTDRKGVTQQVSDGTGQEYHPVPQNGANRVLFYRQTYAPDIFSIDPADPVPVPISPAAGNSSCPRSISASGIAYVRGSGKDAKIATAATGAPGSTLPGSVQSGVPFSVAPDGRSVFAESPAAGKNGVWQVMLDSGVMTGMGENLLMPYEISQDGRYVFFGHSDNGRIRYVIREVKSGSEIEVVSVAGNQRVGRAAWMNRGGVLAYLAADGKLVAFSLKDLKSTTLLDDCLDFAVNPKTDEIAALLGKDAEHGRLALADAAGQKVRTLITFGPDAFARTLDWSRDGRAIYYDRMKAGSDLMAAE